MNDGLPDHRQPIIGECDKPTYQRSEVELGEFVLFVMPAPGALLLLLSGDILLVVALVPPLGLFAVAPGPTGGAPMPLMPL